MQDHVSMAVEVATTWCE